MSKLGFALVVTIGMVACGGASQQAEPQPARAPASTAAAPAASPPARTPVVEEARSAGVLGALACGDGAGGATYGGEPAGCTADVFASIDTAADPGAVAVPSVQVGEPAAPPGLDRAIIRRYVMRSIGRIRFCYEKALLGDPSLKGTVTAKFTIGRDGHVSGSTASGLTPAVASCVAEAIAAIQFPRPDGALSVTVTYPFAFHPEGG